jgi:hypothetical protein
MNAVIIASLLMVHAEPVDTSSIVNTFEKIKRSGTPERVIPVARGEKIFFFRRKFELTSYNIETAKTGNEVIPYLAIVKYGARVKNTGEFETKELAEKARFETDSDSFIEWKAIFRQLKGNWALENIVYKSGSMDMPADLKNTPDARHFVHDWFQALDGY